MKSLALKSLLDRDLSKATAKNEIAQSTATLQEIISYATNAFGRCADTDSSGKNYLPLLSLFRHVIEMTDGIEVLVAESCVVPAIPLLRSSFEADLSVAFLLQKDFDRRAEAWMVCELQKNLAALRLSDPETQQGKNFRAVIASDELAKNMNLEGIDAKLDPDALRKRTDELAQEVAENFPATVAEYKHLKKAHKKPEWYAFYGGPNSVQELAVALKRGGQYEILYRQWSEVTHPSNFSSQFLPKKAGQLAVERLRSSRKMREVSGFAASFLLQTMRVCLLRIRPGEKESFGRWYQTEIAEGYRWFFNLPARDPVIPAAGPKLWIPRRRGPTVAVPVSSVGRRSRPRR